MFSTQRLALGCVLLAAVAAASACGSSSGSTTSAGSQAASSTTGASAGGGALSADATSAATGDIPDNQVFLVFHDPKAGFSIKYPEGWTQSSAADNVTFRDKNNLVRVKISHGPAPTVQSVTQGLNALKASDPSLKVASTATMTLGSGPAVKAVYTTDSAPNPVTGRRVLLIVDRYELARSGKLAIVDLGTPKGVDNVDAYRMMINSFHWQ